jgi:predicted  nucleic acid-binding Zn-ribbon protein
MLHEALEASETYRVKLQAELADAQATIARLSKALGEEPAKADGAAATLEQQVDAARARRVLLHDVRATVAVNGCRSKMSR